MEQVRTIILSNSSNKEQAILNLKMSTESEIKFFNFNNNQNKNFALGIKQGDCITKVPLKIKNNLCKFKLPEDVNLKGNVLCAVVDVSNAFCPEIILSGSNNSKSENSLIEEVFVSKKPEDSSSLYEEESEEEIKNLVEKNLQDDFNSTYFDACANCKYREAFYSDVNNMCTCSQEQTALLSNKEDNDSKTDSSCFIETNSQEEETNENNKEELFYEQIKSQIDELFEKNEIDDILSQIIANSKWVRINYDKTNFYVLGLIYNSDNTAVDFISYGVPSNDKDNPPEDLKDFAQWLPICDEQQNFKGYWLVYQSAINGETVKVDYM